MYSIQNLPMVDLELSKKYGKVYGKFDGTQPNLCISDPDLIKSILVKDFDHFVNRRVRTKTGKIQSYFQDLFFNCFILGSAYARLESLPENAGCFARSGMERCSCGCHTHLHFRKNKTSTNEISVALIERILSFNYMICYVSVFSKDERMCRTAVSTFAFTCIHSRKNGFKRVTSLSFFGQWSLLKNALECFIFVNLLFEFTDQILNSSNVVIDISLITRRELNNVTMDVIARCAFGIEFGGLGQKDDPFMQRAKRVFGGAMNTSPAILIPCKYIFCYSVKTNHSMKGANGFHVNCILRN